MPHPPASASRAGLVALLTLLVSASHVVAQAPPSFRVAGFDVQVIGDLKGFALDGKVETIREGLEILHLQLTRPQAEVPPTFTLKWAVPSHDVAGHWMTGRDLTKSVRPDWSGGRLQRSMFAREAPVSTLFSSRDRNVLTFAVSDALNTIASGSGVREEDGLIYNEVTFFSERHERLTRYTADVRIDRRDIPYGTALEEVSLWWARQPGYEPATVPEPARLPMYSTWYNYHQNVDAAVLLKEVAVAKSLGFESIIVDDGWQTKDSGRGYAFTGDWEPERMPDMKGFVDGSHTLGVKVLLWYAVPFVGKNSKVAARFKDKSLRFDERLGAYVLDPRYPEVRAHVIETYARAIRDWGIDGVKLDFIERFAADEKTVLEATDGRDFASVNEATDRMMTDVIAALKKVRPDVMVEFRQPYIGPLIRKYGNMFRASDCPNAYVTNRVRTIDLRLLSGTTAVHADMIMWHYGEPVEAAALQFLNIMFSVPQVSVRLQDVPRDHLEMITFYTAYWKANRAVLLDGDIDAVQPAANYPLVRARTRDKQIAGVYADMVVDVNGAVTLDILNAKPSGRVVVSTDRDLGPYRYDVKDCRGRVVKSGVVRLDRGVVSLDVPASGLLALQSVAGSARR